MHRINNTELLFGYSKGLQLGRIPNPHPLLRIRVRYHGNPILDCHIIYNHVRTRARARTHAGVTDMNIHETGIRVRFTITQTNIKCSVLSTTRSFL